MAECGDDGAPFCTDSVPFAPASSCCKQGRTCLVLAANTTVICCPDGADCSQIGNIPCDLSRQLFDPSSDIQTSWHEGHLPECGDACCPWGYHCELNTCALNDDQNELPGDDQSSSTSTSSTSSPTTSTTRPSSATSSTATTNTTSQASPTAVPSITLTPAQGQGDASSSSTLSTGETAGIAVGAVLGTAIVALLLYVIYRVRRATIPQSEDDQAQALAVAGGNHQPILSEPKAPELASDPIYELAG
ncbi:uncharacterized protein GGS25DRAFT_475604 [Hypoxylon fragiforme]|uniref:uncharacterized protein n=1 Tax=Hypoxylon fragiforme TaxID=63214 RepID=UPI0020C5CF0B|nr:uncharacterized protein GGS25DRAFT_475604 [Hypoxylon fragiforme]KAI2612489.1 hypothetical protein GGS25DRAFT_475604 [Hypoxylon fragiforme]